MSFLELCCLVPTRALPWTHIGASEPLSPNLQLKLVSSKNLWFVTDIASIYILHSVISFFIKAIKVTSKTIILEILVSQWFSIHKDSFLELLYTQGNFMRMLFCSPWGSRIAISDKVKTRGSKFAPILNFASEILLWHLFLSNHFFYSFGDTLGVYGGQKVQKLLISLKMSPRDVISHHTFDTNTHLGQIAIFYPFWGNMGIK